MERWYEDWVVSYPFYADTLPQIEDEQPDDSAYEDYVLEDWDDED